MACELENKTDNPICSDSLQDLKNNTIIMDQYINSEEFIVPDRLGIPRKTWAGLEEDVRVALANLDPRVEQLIADKIIAQGGVEIANEWGDSPEKVLSQGFVTDNVNSIFGGVLRTKSILRDDNIYTSGDSNYYPQGYCEYEDKDTGKQYALIKQAVGVELYQIFRYSLDDKTLVDFTETLTLIGHHDISAVYISDVLYIVSSTNDSKGVSFTEYKGSSTSDSDTIIKTLWEGEDDKHLNTGYIFADENHLCVITGSTIQGSGYFNSFNAGVTVEVRDTNDVFNGISNNYINSFVLEPTHEAVITGGNTLNGASICDDVIAIVHGSNLSAVTISYYSLAGALIKRERVSNSSCVYDNQTATGRDGEIYYYGEPEGCQLRSDGSISINYKEIWHSVKDVVKYNNDYYVVRWTPSGTANPPSYDTDQQYLRITSYIPKTYKDFTPGMALSAGTQTRTLNHIVCYSNKFNVNDSFPSTSFLLPTYYGRNHYTGNPDIIDLTVDPNTSNSTFNFGVMYPRSGGARKTFGVARRGIRIHDSSDGALNSDSAYIERNSAQPRTTIYSNERDNSNFIRMYDSDASSEPSAYDNLRRDQVTTDAYTVTYRFGGSFSEITAPNDYEMFKFYNVKDNSGVKHRFGIAITGGSFQISTGSTKSLLLNSKGKEILYDATSFSPIDENTVLSLGNTYQRWENIYLKNQPIITSDANAKFDIEDINEKYIRVMSKINFKQFKLKDGASGRTHFGIIAQDWIKACEDCGVDPYESGVLVGSEEEGCAIRYGELQNLFNAYLLEKLKMM